MGSQREVQLCLDVSVTEISLSLASTNREQDKEDIDSGLLKPCMLLPESLHLRTCNGLRF